jgi:5'-3' exonuclease
MQRLVVLDGNPIAYRAFHSPGTRHLRTSTGAASGLFYGFLRTYLALKKRLPKSHFLVCFDAGRSWRNDVCAEYKTHGEDAKPSGFHMQLSDVQEFLKFIGVPVFQEPMLEADDLISVLSCQWLEGARDNSAIIVSSDRDYFQLVSERLMLYDDRAKKFYGPKEVENLTGVRIEYFLNYKCLVGDKADCLSGVYGYGPKKARQYCPYPGRTLSGADLQIYERNRLLIKLPRTAEEVRLHSQDRRRIRLTMQRVFADFTSGLGLVDVGLALRATHLLTYYECKAFCVEDFLALPAKRGAL